MLNIRLAQLNFHVGNIHANCEKIISTIEQAALEEVNLLVFPELAVTGYLPQDLLLRDDFMNEVATAVEKIAHATGNILVILGCPTKKNHILYNSALVLHQGKIIHEYDKYCLPNHGVFDEQRYFTPGKESTVFTYDDTKFGLLICEDIWHAEPIKQAKSAGAEIIICINASPFDYSKPQRRLALLTERYEEQHLPIIYLNMVGGQDELVFDGGSLVINSRGLHLAQASFFEETIFDISLDNNKQLHTTTSTTIPHPDVFTYQALVLATRDYLQKNGFKGALLGLSGGIDSALVLAIAVDAIGAENVQAVMMPSRYTSTLSLEGAEQEAKALGVEYSILSIEKSFSMLLETLAPEFKNTQADITEENLQARCRAMLLMALSNKTGKIVLTTSNKSEMSVGYSTLYGDMAGGFAVLKDVPKQLVYRLARYRNTISPVIPDAVIERAPSAELATGQVDQDSLPPYDILDAIIEQYMEQDKSAEQIIAAGFEAETVNRIIKMIKRNEYKRRQSPPGPKITPRAYGHDRRYPITNGFGK